MKTKTIIDSQQASDTVAAARRNLIALLIESGALTAEDAQRTLGARHPIIDALADYASALTQAVPAEILAAQQRNGLSDAEVVDGLRA